MNDFKLDRCVFGMTLNSFIVVQGMKVELRFEHMDEVVSSGKLPVGTVRQEARKEKKYGCSANMVSLDWKR